MPLYYVDASALAKVVLEERGSAELLSFTSGVGRTSAEIVVAEVARACRRVAASQSSPDLLLERLLERAAAQIDAVALVPFGYETLVAAGELPEPSLRALDAIHIASALSLGQIDGFITYDVRQAASARLAGLRTHSPGV